MLNSNFRSLFVLEGNLHGLANFQKKLLSSRFTENLLAEVVDELRVLFWNVKKCRSIVNRLRLR